MSSKKQAPSPLVNALSCYTKKQSIRFHMPGHKANDKIRFNEKLKKNLFNWDVTEIPGLDNLHEPKGVILKSEKLLAKLYGAKRSFFLVNGSTSGNISMMGAAVSPNQKLIVSRASHRSVLSGLILTGADPIYVMPKFDRELGVFTQPSVNDIKNTINKAPDARAIILTNPVYQGFCPDIKSACLIAGQNNINVLVDEAHGPHFALSPLLPHSAGDFDVDAWVQSPHKILCSLTQSAWLHIKGQKMNINKVMSWLELMTSTSPSYILMASLDLTRALMQDEGKELIEYTLELAQHARHQINKFSPFYCVGSEVVGKRGIFDIDLSRLMVNVSSVGYTGHMVQEILIDKYNIYPEYSDFYNVYFLLSFSNTKKDIKHLVKALSCFKERCKLKDLPKPPYILPNKVMKPKEAFFKDGEFLPLKDCIGRIIKKELILYPPGIPIVMPGEVLDKNHVEYILQILKMGGSCQGIKGNLICVVK